jgi:hypothetical protein
MQDNILKTSLLIYEIHIANILFKIRLTLVILFNAARYKVMRTESITVTEITLH